MHQKYFNKIKKIFTDYKPNSLYTKEVINRGFVYSEFQNKKLLFIGMNPSYIDNSPLESNSYNVENAVLGYKRHYGKFQELVNDTVYQNDWTYIDLFFFRETDQNKISNVINSDVDFIISQLNLTNEIINEINPEIIVVCNSGASNFIGINNYDNKNNIWLGYNFIFDDEFGVEILNNISNKSILENKQILPNLKNKPFIFSSTLTYLDNHNKKRLKWIINRIGKKKIRNYS